MAGRVLLLVGTRKGGFIVEGDNGRGVWTIRGPVCEGWPIHDMSDDPATGTLYAGGGNAWYGPGVFRSNDLGQTWAVSSSGITYGDDGPKISAVWNVTAAHGAINAGVGDAGLFRSEDGGETWIHVEGLTNHPSRPEWQPGAGGLILHTIIPHPTDEQRMWVAISAVGCFETRDGGATWQTRNSGVRADFNPVKYPEFGQCVHKMAMAAGEPLHLYQQNHCGVYRTLDGGETWQEITPGLPSQFGFPIVAHPRDPLTAWTIPLNEPEQGRYVPDGAAAVWRTRDGGDSWTRLDSGLPQEHAYLGILREAMAVDRLDPVGVYFGTSTGQLWVSRDEGDSWEMLTGDLPGIFSVEAVALDA
jgi:photosystem II stability/assembly factor-like uncharacterized protein